MNQKSWRHHYIPQFYLNGFTSPEGKFKIFDVQKNRFIKNGKDFSPEAYFFEKDGNTMEFNGDETDFLEASYARTDNRIAEIFNRINASTAEDKYNVTDHDLATLQHFIGVMYWRIPVNFDEVKDIVNRKKLKALGLVLKNKVTDEIIDDPLFEEKLKSNPNLFKFMKSHFADISYPELFDCKAPLHILPFPPGLPSICSDNPIVCKNPKTFRVYTDDLIFPINSTKLFVRGTWSKDFYSSIKVAIDLLIFKQAKQYVSCTDERYIDQLHNMFEQKYKSLDSVRAHIFHAIVG